MTYWPSLRKLQHLCRSSSPCWGYPTALKFWSCKEWHFKTFTPRCSTDILQHIHSTALESPPPLLREETSENGLGAFAAGPSFHFPKATSTPIYPQPNRHWKLCLKSALLTETLGGGPESFVGLFCHNCQPASTWNHKNMNASFHAILSVFWARFFSW